MESSKCVNFLNDEKTLDDYKGKLAACENVKSCHDFLVLSIPVFQAEIFAPGKENIKEWYCKKSDNKLITDLCIKSKMDSFDGLDFEKFGNEFWDLGGKCAVDLGAPKGSKLM